MANINRIAGTAFLKVDGAQFSLRGSFTVSLPSAEREGIAGLDGVHGYKETPRVPFIEGDVSTTQELDLNTLPTLEGITVQAELANGKTGILRDAWVASANDVNAEEGQVTVRFEGLSGEWL